MPAAAQVVLQVERFHRGRPLVGRFVSFVAVEDLDKIELSLDLDVAHRPLEQENVLGVDDFETVLIGVLDVVVVGNSSAVGASVIKGIVAAGLFPVFVSEVGWPPIASIV